MTSVVGIFDADTIESVVRPCSEHVERTMKYILPLMRKGPQFFIENADVKMLALVVDDLLLPLVVSDGTCGNSNMCSPYSHYVDYARAELDRQDDGPLTWALRTSLSALGVSLRTFQLDRVVFVNNFLWCTNLWPGLSPTQVADVTAHLKKTYPDHAIVFRSVNRIVCDDLFRALVRVGYSMIAARKVYILDGADGGCMSRNDVKTDLKLLGKGPHEVVDGEALEKHDIRRITELYRELYLEKYPSLNPQFNEHFFELVWRERMMNFTALRKDGRIDAFSTFIVEDAQMIGTAIGYDMQMPKKVGLYRQVFATYIKHAVEKGLLLNMSAGAGRFKKFRGAVPTPEYDAVYDAHLPPHRRFPWWLVRSAFTEPVMRRFQE